MHARMYVVSARFLFTCCSLLSRSALCFALCINSVCTLSIDALGQAYVRKHVFEKLNLTTTTFLPPRDTWANCVPTWNDTTPDAPGPGYRNRVIQGQVSDQNAYALGGIAGHAGLFSTAGDIAALTHRILFAQDADSFINKTTATLFTKVSSSSLLLLLLPFFSRHYTPPPPFLLLLLLPSLLIVPSTWLRTFVCVCVSVSVCVCMVQVHNLTQSSRALGWDTNDYKMNSYRGCANLSSTTFTHTGLLTCLGLSVYCCLVVKQPHLCQ